MKLKWKLNLMYLCIVTFNFYLVRELFTKVIYSFKREKDTHDFAQVERPTILFVTKVWSKNPGSWPRNKEDIKCDVRYADSDISKLNNISDVSAFIYHVHDLTPQLVHQTNKMNHHARRFIVNFEGPLMLLPLAKVNRTNLLYHSSITYDSTADYVIPYFTVIPYADYTKWDGSLESPCSSEFHWSMLPKILIDQRKNQQKSKIHKAVDKISNKHKMAAWFVSHCQTKAKREDFVHELQKYIHVDIFGDCGTKICSKLTSGCFETVKKYKFYLSFENNICAEYVTEKLYNALMASTVPVVFGSADYEKVAPPYSYINSLEYKSPEDLAKYLLFLSENHQEYRKYFEWKKHYFVVPVPYFELVASRVCNILTKCDTTRNSVKSLRANIKQRISHGQCRQWNKDIGKTEKIKFTNQTVRFHLPI